MDVWNDSFAEVEVAKKLVSKGKIQRYETKDKTVY